MLSAELDYCLPPELIAQEPVEPREAARLLRLWRATGVVEDRCVSDLPQLLRPDDLLVFNDSRVLHARLRGHKVPGNVGGNVSGGNVPGGRVEALLLREAEVNLWEALLKPSARLRPGAPLCFTSADGALAVAAQPVERTAAGWLLRFEFEGETDIRDLLPRLGEMPLPPYIKRALRDETQYQTIFARLATPGESGKEGKRGGPHDSAAAPTAGLHFTPALLDALRARGVRTACVTLGVGIGTFRPIQTATLEAHAMHEEAFEVPVATARAIEEQRRRGGRVVAVGTTTTRVLESVADDAGRVPPGPGTTRLFIRPGYRFRCVDALLTNFHLPRSTLLAMVAAFAENTSRAGLSAGLSGPAAAAPLIPRQLTGLEKIRYAYSRAVEARYRFFSLGDAMLIE